MKYLVLFSLAILFIQSCTNKTEKTDKSIEQEEKLTTEKLEEKFVQVNDSLQTAWYNMIKSDNEKFADIKRLLQEASYTKEFNPIKLDKLMTRTDSLQQARYKQNNMTSDQIDQYDNATIMLVKDVMTFVSETPELESHAITDELVMAIQKAEGEVVNFRIRYDQWANEYNRLISHYEDELKEAGKPDTVFVTKPVFTLEI